MTAPAKRIAWFAKRYDPVMASIRLRLLGPMAYLRQSGLDVVTFSSGDCCRHLDAIILSKHFSEEAIAVAREMRIRGQPVIFDICDNIFEGKKRIDKQARLARLREVLSLSTHIVYSTPVLAAQLECHTSGLPISKWVIPDQIDMPQTGTAACLNPGERHELSRLRAFVAAHPEALHCVWFGKSQGNMAGFSHLDAAVVHLRHFARHRPVTLTVISNSRLKYLKARLGWRGVPTHYMSWAMNSFYEALSAHDAAVIPVERNSYTIGKTINRPATAILAGLGVIADSIDAYEELRPFIALDDWQGGLRRYSACPPAGDLLLDAARSHLNLRYSADAVGRQWHELLQQALAQTA